MYEREGVVSDDIFANDETKHKILTANHRSGNQNEKAGKARKFLKKSHISEDKQLILGRPRPVALRPRPFPFRLTPAALLIPAIPTLLGTAQQNKNKNA